MLGILGGALGALFINVNTRCARLRKKYIAPSIPRRVIETGMYGVMTISVSVILTTVMLDCKVKNPLSVDGYFSAYGEK